MWLKLEFPFAGEAEKQESRGRGQRLGGRETDKRRAIAPSLHKLKVCHLISRVLRRPEHTPDGTVGCDTRHRSTATK